MLDKNFKNYFSMMDGKYDPWGAAMSALFSICDEMLYMGFNIPSAWGFKPGACHVPERDMESGWGEYFADMDETLLINTGNILNRYISKLDHAGRSY